GRSLNLADSVSAATTAAKSTATQFFNANFTSGFLGTGTVDLSTPTFTQELDSNGLPNGILAIAVTASVPAPTYFMRIFSAIPGMSSLSTVTVSASGTASRRSTVLIMVLDTSISMNTPTTPTACQEMVSAAQSFINNFSPFDTIGAVAFNVTASVIYAPVSTFGDGTLNTALGNVSCGSSTNTTSALWLAYEQIKTVGLPLAYNTIVLFTDGSPNGISANFPLKTITDTRYGQDYTQFNPPYSGTADSCTSTGSTCSMPAVCTASGTVSGTIQQSAGQADTGTTYGPFLPTSTSSTPTFPSSCNSTAVSESTVSGASSDTPPQYGVPDAVVRQLVAYIPDFDLYGNSTHGVPSTSTPPTCPGSTCTVATVTLKSTGATYTYDTRDFWRYATNNVCSGATGSAATACANDSTPGTQYEGGVWSSFPADSGSNFFTATGSYKGYMRPDQPNTIVAAGMNAAMSEAYWIRQDASGCPGMGSLGTNGTVCTTLYHPTIDTIYLTGNAGDQVDHEFLPIIANAQTIPALPYDSSFTPYTNPAYQSGQQQGLYQVTADKTQLTALFQALASQVLRLSQ
ncbi:MAG: VWA domain-containing protein, partial [Candidatus Acidiferrales bacterium]